jgi:hypothetical protein
MGFSRDGLPLVGPAPGTPGAVVGAGFGAAMAFARGIDPEQAIGMLVHGFCEEVFKKPVVVTDYPKEIKAFYMRENEDGKTVRAMDILAPRIGEIVGGSQREERFDVLERKVVEQCAKHALPQLIAAFGVVGQALEHGVEAAGLFSRPDRGAIDLREHPWEAAERRGERIALHDPRADPGEDPLGRRPVGLLGDGLQGFLQRQRRPYQGRQLPRDQCEVPSADARRWLTQSAP